jgi:hypothetical protein
MSPSRPNAAKQASPVSNTSTQVSRGTSERYTRNFVVFDEKLISIVKKYGIAGAATMLGVSALDVEQALADNLAPSDWEDLVAGPQ